MGVDACGLAVDSLRRLFGRRYRSGEVFNGDAVAGRARAWSEPEPSTTEWGLAAPTATRAAVPVMTESSLLPARRLKADETSDDDEDDEVETERGGGYRERAGPAWPPGGMGPGAEEVLWSARRWGPGFWAGVARLGVLVKAYVGMGATAAGPR